MKIVVLDGHAINPGDITWKPIEALGELIVYDRTRDDQLLERISGAQVVFTNKARITAQLMDTAPSVKWIGILATGYEIVDIEAASQRGIPVCNVADYSTIAVAEMVFALLFELCRRVGAHAGAVSRGEWTASPDFCFWIHPQSEIFGKTIGIVGLGNIGKRTAHLAQAFGLKVLAASMSKTLPENEMFKYVELDELFEKSDIISLHCPLTPQTRRIIDANAIESMKDGVMLINTARGPLIDETALRDALDRGKVGGAACDVVSAEPIRADNPLLGAKNMIITPHIAWASQQSRQRLVDMAAENLAAYLAGGLKGAVNMANLA